MTCTADQALSCDPGLAPRYTEAQVSTYADRAGASGAPWIRPMAITFLRVNRVIYWKNTPQNLVGDCDQNSAPNGLPTGIKASQLGITGVGTVAGIATGIGGAGASIAGIGAAALGAAAAGAGLVLIPIMAIFAHHAQAVQTEQQTLCQVAIQYDQFADAIEQAIASGQVPLQDALAKLNSVLSSIDSGLASIEKPYNAPYGYRRAVKALGLFNAEVVYPSLVPGIASKALGAIESPSGVLAAGGAVLAAKVFGVI